MKEEYRKHFNNFLNLSKEISFDNMKCLLVNMELNNDPQIIKNKYDLSDIQYNSLNQLFTLLQGNSFNALEDIYESYLDHKLTGGRRRRKKKSSKRKRKSKRKSKRKFKRNSKVEKLRKKKKLKSRAKKTKKRKSKDKSKKIKPKKTSEEKERGNDNFNVKAKKSIDKLRDFTNLEQEERGNDNFNVKDRESVDKKADDIVLSKTEPKKERNSSDSMLDTDSSSIDDSSEHINELESFDSSEDTDKERHVAEIIKKVFIKLQKFNKKHGSIETYSLVTSQKDIQTGGKANLLSETVKDILDNMSEDYQSSEDEDFIKKFN